jgi:hypothetical protein
MADTAEYARDYHTGNARLTTSQKEQVRASFLRSWDNLSRLSKATLNKQHGRLALIFMLGLAGMLRRCLYRAQRCENDRAR